MAAPRTMGTLLRRLLGAPEVSFRVRASTPFTLEQYRIVLDVAEVPPLPERLLWVHTGGKPVTYRARSSRTDAVSLPGLVTLVPAGVAGQAALRGVGEAVIAYFDGPRGVPDWVAARRDREPVTIFDNVVATLAQQLVVAGSEPRPDERYLGVLGEAMLAQLRHVLETAPVQPELRGSRSALMLVHQAVRHIQQNIDAPLGVAELAAAAGVGVTHFSNTFRQVTGTTPHRYVLRARIARARELLRMTSLPVGEIASAVGFAGQSHFCTAFGRETGLTPSRYRRQCAESGRQALRSLTAGRD